MVCEEDYVELKIVEEALGEKGCNLYREGLHISGAKHVVSEGICVAIE